MVKVQSKRPLGGYRKTQWGGESLEHEGIGWVVVALTAPSYAEWVLVASGKQA